VDLRSIRYFVQIADCGSISRAAKHLGVAQPALSRHLHSLEEELGARLLVRLPRGVRLTGTGRQFFEHCRRILREVARAREEVRAGARLPRGRVVLGVSPTIAALMLPGIVERARRQCPHVALKATESFSTLLYDALLTGRLDVAVMTNPPPSRGLKLTPLITEPLVVLTPPQPRGTRRFYTLAELAKTPLVMSDGIRGVAEEQLGRYGVRLALEAEIDSIEAIRQLLLRGVGATILPISTFHDDVRSGRLCAFQIADANVHRMLVLGRPAEQEHSAAVEEISQLVVAEVDALYAAGFFSVPAPGVQRAARGRRDARGLLQRAGR
jgi:LysR family nitrogen assimilation transcriptional regulator